jgi:Fe-S oxidoreductase
MALEEFRAEAERCSQCSYCKWIPFDQMKSVRFSRGCPSIAYANFNSYSARGRYSLSLALLEKRIGYDEKVKEIANQCCLCGNCDVSCKLCRYNLEPVDMIRELRAQLVADNQTIPQHLKLIESLRQNNNFFSEPPAQRGEWASGLKVKNLNQEKAPILFHAGCRFSYDESLAGKARAALELLAGAGLDVGVLGQGETCCGGKAYDMGYREDFERLAKRNLAAWKKAGVKTVVTSCADCYSAFKRLYPKLGSQFEILHTAEYLDRLINTGKIRPSRKLDLKVTYHDPCHLGRRGEPYVPWAGQEKKIKSQIVVYEPRRPRYNGAQGVYEPPRNVLKRLPGLTLVEMPRKREYAWCCGAGSGTRESYPEFSQWTAAERIEEAKTTGAEALVTACSGCERNLADAIAASGANLKVFDIAELVKQAI